jgi:hypothetical protein
MGQMPLPEVCYCAAAAAANPPTQPTCYFRVVPAADVLPEEGFINGHTTAEAHLCQDLLKPTGSHAVA